MTRESGASDHRKRLGTKGEQCVAEALKARGFTILAANLRARWGEIDLVARKEDALWFVEVKTRRTSAFGPCDVSQRQKHRLTRMAHHFLQHYGETLGSAQFVVAAVSFESGQPDITFIEQAFESTF